MVDKKVFRQDYMVQGLIAGDSLRVAICDVTMTVREAQERHNLDPLATITLGRALAGCAVMGSNLKTDESYIQCHFRGDGPLGSVIAEYIAPASLRGFVAVPQIAQQLTEGDALPQTVGEAIGKKGTLTVKVGRLDGKTAHTGVCQLLTGEVAEDLAYYYLESEQIPTILGSGVTLDDSGAVVGAGGILIQKVGGAEPPEDALEQLEYRVKHGQALSQQIAQGRSPEEILSSLSPLDGETTALTSKSLGFNCFCHRNRMAMALISLGEEELKRIKAESGEISAHCHFCASTYQFELEELTRH